MKRSLMAGLLALSLALGGAAQAHGNASEASSALSLLPVAVSVAVPVGLLSAGAALTVVSVATVAEGTLWMLERASDGVQASITVSGQLAVGVSVVAGTAVTVSVCSAGWVLSAAGQAIAFIPNELGKALLYNERLTR